MANYVGLKAKLDSNTDSHLTLWVLPDVITDEQTTQIKEILDQFEHYQIGVKFKSFDNFGPNKDIPVIKVQDEVLFTAIRNRIAKTGIADASSYEFIPHITLPQEMDPIVIPRVIWCGFIYAITQGSSI